MTNPKALIAILLVIFSIESFKLSAQIKRYTFNDGFDFIGARSIVQDGYGFIWMQSEYFLSKFDGYTFTYYKHNREDSLSLIGPVIGRLLVDNTGNLWINNAEATWLNGSLVLYDREHDNFVNYKPNIKSFVRCISIENDNSLLWIGTMPHGYFSATQAKSEDTGLYSLDLKTHEVIPYLNRSDDDQFEKNNNIHSIENRGGNLLLGTANGLWSFNKTSKTFSRPQVSDSATLLTGLVTKSERYFIKWDEGRIFKVDSSFTLTHEFIIPQKIKEGLVDLEGTHDDKFWCIVGENEIVYWDPQINLVETKHKSFDDLRDLLFDKNQNLWFAGNSELARLEPQIFSYTKTPKNIWQWNYHIVRNEKSDLGILLGSSNQIATTPIAFGPIKLSHFDFQGRTAKWSNYNWFHEGKEHIWIGTWGRGVIGLPIDRENGILKKTDAIFFENIPDNSYTLTINNSRGLCEDGKGNLWVCTNGEGICLINLKIPYGSEGSVQRFSHDPNDANSISSNLPNIPLVNSHGVWIGTDRGIDLYKDGKFTNIFNNNENFNHLLSSNNGDIYGLSQYGLYVSRKRDDYKKFTKVLPTIGSTGLIHDNLGRIWISELNRFQVFDPATSNSISLMVNDDFKSGYGGFAISSEGYIGFASDNAIITFDPALLKVDSSKTNPLLTKVLINNKQPIIGNRKPTEDTYHIPYHITVLEQLVLDYLHNNFSLEFSAMEMTKPEGNRYLHKLEGYDPDWIETDYRDRTATYTNLPSGTYTFRVKASNHHGVWSDNERTLKVIILPPPWRTWWAYTGYALLVAGLLVWARRNIVQRERLKSNLVLEKVEREKEHFELEKAKEVDRVKTSFFTNISHEFRTPLTLIKGPIEEMLDQFKEDPKVQARLKMVQRNSDLLLKLINQLLDLAKLESGSLKVEKTEGDLFSFIRAIANSFESLARQKNVSLNVVVPPESYSARFDKDKLETILINLINNAIKFTKEGAVSVRGSIESSALMLTVKDTGIGIPEDQQSRIFERFHQVSEAHKEVGTGIGLALVKELVVLLGGSIEVQSKVGEGSIFSVILPIEVLQDTGYELQAFESVKTEIEPKEHVASELESRQTTSSGQTTTVQPKQDHNGADTLPKPHILVVEDNSDLRAFIIDSLGDEFYFLEAENGKQGVEIATDEVPDLIISDVMMPEMDGITMAGKVKADVRTSHIPLILLTAKSTDESKLSGLQSGADDYLTKPFNKTELLLKVRNSIAVRARLREKIRAELMSTAPRQEVLSADEQFLQKVKEAILHQLGDEQLSVESLADDIGLSRVQLYRKISALTGISVNELIRKLRLQKAAQLLEAKWGPVSQVAYEVGFSNLSYFSKVFREEFGVLPSEYTI